MKKRLVLVAVLLATSVGLGATPALASEGQTTDGGYLALGDSVPFGFNPLVSPVNPANFVGYPEAFVLAEERPLTNASCPGETSASLFSMSARDNGCRGFRSYFPLHAAYPRTQTQLVFAVAYLQSHRDTRLVSLTVGANDLFLLIADCNQVVACELAGLRGLLTNLGQNLASIYSAIRATGYSGRLAAVTYYALDYADPTQVAVLTALDGVISSVTQQFGGDVADGFGAFKTTAAAFGGNSCAAGLLIKVSMNPLRCDVHPSAAGRDLLSEALQQVQRGPQN